MILELPFRKRIDINNMYFKSLDIINNNRISYYYAINNNNLEMAEILESEIKVTRREVSSFQKYKLCEFHKYT